MFVMLTVGDIKKATQGKLIQGEALTKVFSVSIDSRSIKKRSVFIAINGERFNGHDFIRQALRKGAIAVVVSKRIHCSDDIAIILVKDTTRALGQVAAWHRSRFLIPIIAITGSVGKTTTKELIASVLSKRWTVLKNVKTENNHYGVPLTLLKLNSSHQVAVLELGTNQPGDIRCLAQIVRPTVSVFTNIGQSHLKGLKNQNGVFKEKIQLIKYMDPKGIVIVNGDDDHLRTLARKEYTQRIIRLGRHHNADYRADQLVVQNNSRLQFKMRGHTFRINSPAFHNVYNALAAISCGLLYKIRYNDIDAALTRFRFREARQEIIKKGRFWFIDDTYNANPLSFQSAVSTLSHLKVTGKRIIVCADMLELGSQSETLHRLTGRMIAQSQIDAVFTVGKHARYITQSLNRSNGIRAVHCRNLSEVHRRLKSYCAPGDAVLVKGSRGMKMERTIKFLQKLATNS